MFSLHEWSRSKFYFIPAVQMFKACLPHVVLIFVNLSYIVAGSFLFITLESGNEIEIMLNKKTQLTEIYENLSNSSYAACFELRLTQEEFTAKLQKGLFHLSLFHDNTAYVISSFLNSSTEFSTSWEVKKAIVYALTLTTTTGFNELNALTKIGKITSVAYALIGIPLMFLTAADVGKLLSEVVTNCWARLMQEIKIRSWCNFQDWKKKESLKRRRTTRETLRQLTIVKSTERRRQSYLYHNMPLEVPGWLISLLALGYICGAGLIFTQARGWSFIESVHFAFDAMTSITMGFTPVDTIFYLLWLVIFCIFGLSVITMCLDLARMKLRNLFIRLHYHGIKLGETFLRQKQLDKETLLLADAIREMREMGFDSMDISALLEYWMKKKQAQEDLERMLANAYKPCDLDNIPLIDKKPSKASCISVAASIVAEEDIDEMDMFVLD